MHHDVVRSTGRQRETTYRSCKLTLTFGFRVDALPHGRGLKHRAEAGEAESPVVAALAVLGRGVKDARGRDAVRLVALQPPVARFTLLF